MSSVEPSTAEKLVGGGQPVGNKPPVAAPANQIHWISNHEWQVVAAKPEGRLTGYDRGAEEEVCEGGGHVFC